MCGMMGTRDEILSGMGFSPMQDQHVQRTSFKGVSASGLDLEVKSTSSVLMIIQPQRKDYISEADLGSRQRMASSVERQADARSPRIEANVRSLTVLATK